jgi:hypothetical protein
VTGYRSRFFRHSCAVDGCYYDSLPCWDDLIDCLPRPAMRPTDVDGLLEINGRVLFLEEKRRGVSLEVGQRRALQRLAQAPDTTVVCFRPGRTTDLDVLKFDQANPAGTSWQPTTRAQFLARLRAWAQTADIRPRRAS